ncbi:hypothetical protein O982_25330 [Mycobacterium avium 10-5581]|nr:hypothetical protein O982_25330 [Mycobacterium avium 10-5581]
MVVLVRTPGRIDEIDQMRTPARRPILIETLLWCSDRRHDAPSSVTRRALSARVAFFMAASVS